MRYDPSGNWIQIGRYWLRLSDGFRLPVIQGGGKAVTVQNDRYAFGDDDGSESGHTLDTENTTRSAQVPDVTFLIRIQVEETGGTDDSWTFQLFAQKNGSGGFTGVTTTRTDGIKLANDTQSRVDNEATTERLTAGAGSFLAGYYDDGQTEDGMGSALVLNTQYTDLEFAIQIDSANASNNDYWEFRIESNIGTDLDSYPGSLPTVTADILEIPSPSVSDGLTIGESTTLQMSDVTLSVSDGLTLTDIPQYYQDDILIGEAITVSVGEGEPEPSVSDGITVGESTSVTLPDALVLSVSDDITIGESTTAEAARIVDVSDDVTVGESTTVTLPDALAISETDDLTIGETTSAALDDEIISVSDALTVGEANIDLDVGTLAARTIDVFDDITIGENVTASLPDALSFSVSDNLTIGDVPNVVREAEGELTISVSDGITLGESTIIKHDDEAVSVSDNVTIADAVNVSISTGISVSDSLTLGESTSVTPSAANISVTDGIAVGDNVTLSMSDLTLALSDNVTVADAVSVQRVDVSLDLDISVVSGLTLGESVEIYQFAAIIEAWTLHSRSTAWTIEDRDMDWSIQDRDTAWTIEDRDMDWSIQDRDTAWTVEDR